MMRWKFDDEKFTWSPQMRRWMGDARRHGMPVLITRQRISGTGKFVDRITDTGVIRVTDDNVTHRIVDFSSAVRL